MKILHTADVHIREYNDEGWQALEQIIRLGSSEKIDVLVISGDLFNSDVNAHNLRSQFRELFGQVNFHTLLIPGNHDAQAYPEGIFLGERVTIIRDLFKPIQIGNAFFWGFPYQEIKEVEILENLHSARDVAQEGATHLLLFHGELLDISGVWENYGQEGQQRYLPVKLSYFKDLCWQYVLAGHFHSNFDVHQFRDDGYFVYSGSPHSVTRREIGPRKVNIFTPGRPPEAITLQTPYFESINIRLNPFQEINPIQVIKQKLTALPSNARPLLTISGYFNGQNLSMTEQSLHAEIQKLAEGKTASLELRFQDIHAILEDDLFKVFLKKLQRHRLNETEENLILEMTIKAMMEISA